MVVASGCVKENCRKSEKRRKLRSYTREQLSEIIQRKGSPTGCGCVETEERRNGDASEDFSAKGLQDGGARAAKCFPCDGFSSWPRPKTTLGWQLGDEPLVSGPEFVLLQ